MKKTRIEWCDSTWNPVTGCLHNCTYCYARRIANRFGDKTDGVCDEWHDLHTPFYKMNVRLNPYPYGFAPTFHRYRLDEPQKIKKPSKIFVCSMADLFGDWVPDEWIQEVFEACEKAPQHKYLFLTKNPKRLCELANTDKLPASNNFWYGSTVTSKNSLRYPERFKDNTFLSIEPLLEPIKIPIWKGLKQIILGAETGNRKGKVIPKKEWIDSLVEQADEYGIRVFMKNSLKPIMGDDFRQDKLIWEEI